MAIATTNYTQKNESLSLNIDFSSSFSRSLCFSSLSLSSLLCHSTTSHSQQFYFSFFSSSFFFLVSMIIIIIFHVLPVQLCGICWPTWFASNGILWRIKWKKPLECIEHRLQDLEVSYKMRNGCQTFKALQIITFTGNRSTTIWMFYRRSLRTQKPRALFAFGSFSFAFLAIKDVSKSFFGRILKTFALPCGFLPWREQVCV